MSTAMRGTLRLSPRTILLCRIWNPLHSPNRLIMSSSQPYIHVHTERLKEQTIVWGAEVIHSPYSQNFIIHVRIYDMYHITGNQVEGTNFFALFAIKISTLVTLYFFLQKLCYMGKRNSYIGSLAGQATPSTPPAFAIYNSRRLANWP